MQAKYISLNQMMGTYYDSFMLGLKFYLPFLFFYFIFFSVTHFSDYNSATFLLVALITPLLDAGWFFVLSETVNKQNAAKLNYFFLPFKDKNVFKKIVPIIVLEFVIQAIVLGCVLYYFPSSTKNKDWSHLEITSMVSTFILAPFEFALYLLLSSEETFAKTLMLSAKGTFKNIFWMTISMTIYSIALAGIVMMANLLSVNHLYMMIPEMIRKYLPEMVMLLFMPLLMGQGYLMFQMIFSQNSSEAEVIPE